jgi:peptide/nickel transport system substrate-binding protein
MKKWYILVAVLLAGLALVACEPQVVTQEVVVTQVVEKEVVVTEVVEVAGTPQVVEVTKIVPVEVTVEPTPVPPAGPVTGGEGDVYRLGMISDITTLQIWKSYSPEDASFYNYAVNGYYYPGLFTYSDQRFDYVPQLAADFQSELEQEGDFWVSTVPLKQGVLWSDGTEITAEDSAWTANTVLAFDLSGNWEAYDGNFLDHVEALDPYTVKVFYHTKPGLARHQFGTMLAPIVSKAFWEPLVQPLLDQMAAIADLDPESEEYIAQREEIIQALFLLDDTGEPVYGGWIFSQWEPGAYVENVRNDNYAFKGMVETEYANGAYKQVWSGGEFVAYGDATGDVQLELTNGPFFQSALYSIYDQDAATLALQAGEIDFVLTPNGLSQGTINQLTENPDIDVVTNPANGFRYLSFNFTRPPLDDVAVRQAINCMIDKNFLTNNLLQGQAIAVYTPVPMGNSFWYNPDVTIFCDGYTAQERLDWSVSRLKEAGYTWEVEPSWNEERGGSVDYGQGLMLPDGSAFPEMTLLAPSAGYDPLRATAGVYAEQWMQQLGMPVTAELTNFNNILDAIYSTPPDFDMYILGWGLSLYPDYVCDFFYTGSGFNNGQYSNTDFDALCDEFYAETDLDTARQMNYQLQDILAQELPYVYLFTTPMRDAYNGAAIMFPYTDVLDGVGPGYYGLPLLVQAVQ